MTLRRPNHRPIQLLLEPRTLYVMQYVLRFLSSALLVSKFQHLLWSLLLTRRLETGGFRLIRDVSPNRLKMG